MTKERTPEPIGAVARRLRVLRSVPTALTEAQRQLAETSVGIFGDTPAAKDAAFIARELVLASLPHSNPGDRPLWTRRNGDVTLAIQPGINLQTGKSYGYPYGIIPRLLLFWMTTEALRKKNRRLELGSSLNGFLAELGLSGHTGRGKRGDAKRLRDQMERLFRSRFSLERVRTDEEQTRKSWLDMQVAPQGELWWSVREPDQGALWGSWIELGELFYTALTSAPVPVDMRALRALKRSPLALDLYAWLTFQAFRAHHGKQPRFETWAQLHSHMGGDYTDIADFRKKAKAALRKILAVYPGLRLSGRQGGIEVSLESLPAIQPREPALDD
jgi:hypothetical protein